jgi:hypothetical protein
VGLTAQERETVITLNDADGTAEVFTHQRSLITKLKKNEAAILIEEGVFETTRWARFEIPKNLVTFRAKRRKATPTSGQGFRSKNGVLEDEL